jgi:hypothetical protein
VLDRSANLGSAKVLAGINLLLMSLVALSFSQGPYSSFEQELWYRYRSLGFFFAGALIPAAVLWFGRRSHRVVSAVLIWMALALFLFVQYVFFSGGGV